MPIAKLGARSLERLNTCEPDLVRVIRRAEQISPMDFTVLAGVRTDAEQAALYAKGRTGPGPVVTHVDGVRKRSRHQPNDRGLSEAVDLAPYPIDWDNTQQFLIFGGVVLAAAAIEGVDLRWGGDWDRDWNVSEHRFIDLPHFELRR